MSAPAGNARDPARTNVLVWDVPVRIVHWALVALVAFSWWSAENGELAWHRYSGYALLGLVTFRLYWGFAGSSTARFRSFVRGPRAILAHLRTARIRAPSPPGHNPLGALSVLALLLLLVTQIGLGLFAVDVDGIESGPLSHLVSFAAGRACAELHEDLFDVLFVFICLHVVAVLLHVFYKRDNLIAAMLHGRRDAASVADFVPPRVSLGALAIGVALAGAIVWIVTGGVL